MGSRIPFEGPLRSGCGSFNGASGNVVAVPSSGFHQMVSFHDCLRFAASDRNHFVHANPFFRVCWQTGSAKNPEWNSAPWLRLSLTLQLHESILIPGRNPRLEVVAVLFKHGDLLGGSLMLRKANKKWERCWVDCSRFE